MDPDPETLRPNPLTSPSTPPIPYPPIDRPSSPSLSNFLKKYTKIRRRQHVFNGKNNFLITLKSNRVGWFWWKKKEKTCRYDRGTIFFPLFFSVLSRLFLVKMQKQAHKYSIYQLYYPWTVCSQLSFFCKCSKKI